MFYVCIVTEDEPYRTMYAEHFLEQVDRDKRAYYLKGECYHHDGASWKLWQGEEPFESVIARIHAPIIEGETAEDRQKRLDALALEAAKSSTSVLCEPEIDDRPEEFRE